LIIASWNINSVRRRIGQLDRLADETNADIICLQETKVADTEFPAVEIAALGYPYQAVAGFGGYNGVAILSKHPLNDIERHVHCERDDARHISAVVQVGDGEVLSINNVYVPAGGHVPDADLNPKFAHKLKFVDAVADYFAGQFGFRDNLVVVGDLNIAPLPSDVWDHTKLSRVVTHTPIEIEALERFKRSLNFIDALREVVPENDSVFTWWSYRAADWKAVNKGRRLDHVWVSMSLRDKIGDVDVLSDVRNWNPPSDHVPLVLKLNKI
jgi:exodeoxyribonuclease III